jgi:neocarzinostatin family protein
MKDARTRAAFALAVAATIFFAACGSSSKSSSSTTTSAAAATTSTSAAAPAQSLTITPATGLTDGQTVQIMATGFTKAGETLGVTECADKGAQTGAGDCDLRNIKAPVTADASGNVSTSYVVHKSFGANNIVCSATQKCLLSVATAGSASPDQVAVANITFSS